MAASSETVRDVCDVLVDHLYGKLTMTEWTEFVNALCAVDARGNESFRTTIEMIARELALRGIA